MDGDDTEVGDVDGGLADESLLAGPPVLGVKLASTTLLEESIVAFQQFSIGKQPAFFKKML